MEEFWKNALKVGGPVAIVAFVLWVVVINFFNEQILTLFSSDQIFIVLLLIVSGLLICLMSAILTFSKKSNSTGAKAVFKDTTIKGDVVLGDKNNNKDS